jgi:hypothetical protein
MAREQSAQYGETPRPYWLSGQFASILACDRYLCRSTG